MPRLLFVGDYAPGQHPVRLLDLPKADIVIGNMEDPLLEEGEAKAPLRKAGPCLSHVHVPRRGRVRKEKAAPGAHNGYFLSPTIILWTFSGAQPETPAENWKWQDVSEAGLKTLRLRSEPLCSLSHREEKSP